MLFSSLEFLLFFPCVLLLHWLAPMAWRRLILLAASYYFYMSWNPPFVALLVFSTILDYRLSRRLELESDEGRRRALVLVSVFVNLGLLGYFKYARFFAENLSAVGLKTGWHFEDIILPLGISFYTFQTMSYTIDVYRRKIPASKRFLDFALYVTFFPQLIAGPIVRASDFLPQLDPPVSSLSSAEIRRGLELLVIGFFKKVYLADHLAIVVDDLIKEPSSLGFLSSWIAIYAFAFQIYFDFSGYSDIARGLGQLLGFKIPINFNLPYLATSITDFWHRWHITLSTWLRDYLYISLGGNRGSRFFVYRNLMLTMLIGGLWHGAGWNFVIWGGLHGIYLVIHKLRLEHTKIEELRAPTGWRRWLGILFTFHLVCLTWVFFRLPDFGAATTVLGSMFGLHGMSLKLPAVALTSPVIQCALVYGLVRLKLRSDREELRWSSLPFWILVLVFAICYLPPGARKFVYFEF